VQAEGPRLEVEDLECQGVALLGQAPERQDPLLGVAARSLQRMIRMRSKPLGKEMRESRKGSVDLDESHSVAAAVQVPFADGQQGTYFPVGVVHHRVEYGHVAQARVVGAAGQRDQVHVGVVIDP
jgi:hypothetical protein